MVGSNTLNGEGNNLSCAFFTLFLGSLFVLHDPDGLFVSQVTFEIVEDISLCLILGEAGNFFKHIQFTLLDFFCFFQLLFGSLDLLVDGFVFLFQIFKLLLNGFFLLLNSSFLTLDFLAAVRNLMLGICQQLMGFVLAGNDGFLFGGLPFCGRLHQ